MRRCEMPVGRANLRAVRLQFRLDLRSRNSGNSRWRRACFSGHGGIAISRKSRPWAKGYGSRCDRIVTSEIIPKPNARDASTAASDHLQRLIERRLRTGVRGYATSSSLGWYCRSGGTFHIQRIGNGSDHRRRRGPDRHVCRGLLRRPQFGRAGDDRWRLPVGLHPGPWHRPPRSHLRDPARHAGLPRGVDAGTCRAPGGERGRHPGAVGGLSPAPAALDQQARRPFVQDDLPAWPRARVHVFGLPLTDGCGVHSKTHCARPLVLRSRHGLGQAECRLGANNGLMHCGK